MEIEDDALPEFICPITQAIMTDPVITTCGHTFERAAILTWFEGRTTCPADNGRLLAKHVSPNLALKSAIEAYIAQHPIVALNDQLQTDFKLAVKLREESLARQQEKHVPSHLSALFQRLGLEEYLPTFMDEGYDTLERCVDMDRGEMVDMGMKKGHAKQLLKALKAPSSSRESDQLAAYLTNSLVQLRNISDERFAKFNNTDAVLLSYNAETECYGVQVGDCSFPIQRKYFVVKGCPIDGTAGHFSKAHLRYAKSPVALMAPRIVGMRFEAAKRCETLLFIGPTGAGKSRLINFVLGQDMFVSKASLQSITKEIAAVTVHRLLDSDLTPTQLNFVDTVGMLDSKLSNKEVLSLATAGVQHGFTTLNRFVFVLRNGRLTPPVIAAIEQAIKWCDLTGQRVTNCVVIITHCDALSSKENELVLQRYKHHAVVGKLFRKVQYRKKGRGSRTYPNFVCVGLPDLCSMDPDLQSIFRKRLVVQRQALINLLGGYYHAPISPTAGCTLL